MLVKRLMEIPDQYKIWFRLDYHNECIEIKIDDISTTPTKSITRYMDMSSEMPKDNDIVFVIDYMLKTLVDGAPIYDICIVSNENVKI